MSKTISELKKKIKKAEVRRQELLVELRILERNMSEQNRKKDLREIEKIKKQLLIEA